METKVCLRFGMMCARRALVGRSLSSGIGSNPVCVDVMMSPLGIWTWTPGLAGLMFSVVSSGVLKWEVVPLSRIRVGGANEKGEFVCVLLHLLSSFLLSSSARVCHILAGLPTSLPPILFSRVASLMWPGLGRLQVKPLWSGCTRKPCDQQ